jgi:ABC-type transport system substrate-binding protein
MKRLIFTATALAILIITIIGCAQPSTEPTKPAAASPTTTPAKTTTPQPQQPVYGGVFREVQTSSPASVGDPAIHPSPPTFYAPCGESLYYSDKQGNPVPRLATKWEFSPDLKSVTFTLRKGVKFQDGTDFNAEAAKFCLDRGRLGQAPSLKPVKSVDVLDDYTIRLNWDKFDFSVWDTLGSNRGPSRMVSPSAIKAHDPDWARLNLAATGAFQLVSAKSNVAFTYDKFNGYWQKGLPYLDRVEEVIFADLTTALIAFKAGQVDMIKGLTPSAALDLKKDGQYNVVAVPGDGAYFGLSARTPGSPFADIKVRRAVNYALDNKALADGIGRGYFLPSNQPYPPWNSGYTPDIKGYPYDPAKAKQLLTEAGYPNGFKTKVYYTAGLEQDLFVAVQTYLKAVGIDAELQPVASAMLVDLQNKSGWDGLLYGGLRTVVGMDPGALMQSMGYVTWGNYFISVLRTDDTIALLEQANTIADMAMRKTLLQKMSKLIIDEYAMICPIYYTQTLTALQPNVHDIGYDEFAFTYEKAWLSK